MTRQQILDKLFELGIDLSQDWKLVPDRPTDEDRKNIRMICYAAIAGKFGYLKEFFDSLDIPYANNAGDDIIYSLYQVNYVSELGESVPEDMVFFRNKDGEPLKFWELTQISLYFRAVYRARLEGMTLYQFYKAYDFMYKPPMESSDEHVRQLVAPYIQGNKVIFPVTAKAKEDYFHLTAIADYRGETENNLVAKLGLTLHPAPLEWISMVIELKKEVAGLAGEGKVLTNIRNEHPQTYNKVRALAALKRTTVKTLLSEWGFDFIDYRTLENQQQLAEILEQQFPNHRIPSIRLISDVAKTKIRSLKRIGNRTNEEVLEELGFELLSKEELAYEKLLELAVDINGEKIVNTDTLPLELKSFEIFEYAEEKGLKLMSFKTEYLVSIGFSYEKAVEIVG